MGLARGRGRPPRRSRASHRQWLSEKRELSQSGLDEPAPATASKELASSAPPRPAAPAAPAAPPHGGGPPPATAQDDFRTYYEAQRLFGEGPGAAGEYAALWQSLRRPLPVTVVVDGYRPAAAGCEARLRADGWRRRAEFDRAGASVWEFDGDTYTKVPGVKVWTERENHRGSLVFQELVSILPALVLAPRPNELVLDLCAAPGSKTIQLLRAMDTTTAVEAAGPSAVAGASARRQLPAGAVLSVELDAQRCCIVLPRNLAKAGSPASCAALANAQHFPVLLGPARAPLQFPRILLDAPCSGDGTVRKNTQLWRSWRRREAIDLFSKQRNLLLRALYLLPVGGACVYSTCSLNPLENEAVVWSVLRRWQQDGNRDGQVDLLDARALSSDRCGLRSDPGLARWVVPALGRGGPLFASWEEVPKNLTQEGGCRWPLRPEMFPVGASEEERSVFGTDITNLRRCARFYPHRGDTGGFFVAAFWKGRPRFEGPRRAPHAPRAAAAAAAAAGANLGRQHPLLSGTWARVAADDKDWRELRGFYGLDAAWSQEQLQRGLFFWQVLQGRRVRLSLVSAGVARVFDAESVDGKPLPWVRLGTFLFELLPRNFLSGIAASRWQVSAEGAARVAPFIRNRWVGLDARDLARCLNAEYRQVPLAEVPGALTGPGFGAGARAREADEAAGEPRAADHRRHLCGGALVVCTGADGRGGSLARPVPAVVTPLQLKLLLENREAEALAEDAGRRVNDDGEAERAAATRRENQKTLRTGDHCCWEGLLRWLSGRGWRR